MSFYVMLLYNCGAKVQKKQKVIKGVKQKHKKIFLFMNKTENTVVI